MRKRIKNYTELFSNYEAFYNTLISCTALSNDFSDAYKTDATKIVELICKTYGLSDTTKTEFSTAIFDVLCQVATLSDAEAVKKNEGESDRSDEDTLFYMKSTIIEGLTHIAQTMNFGPYQDKDCFDYAYLKPYQENMRFSKLNRTASCGIVVATRQVAIMQILGIGCKQDLEAAHGRLVSCAYWGDVFSAYLLAELYGMTGKKEKHDLCLSVAKLCDKYLYTGRTVLPDDVKTEYGEEACLEYALISTILQDVIYANNLVRINFSFVEAITDEKLSYYQKMKYVNEYLQGEWQEVTNSSVSPDKKFGFR